VASEFNHSDLIFAKNMLRHRAPFRFGIVAADFTRIFSDIHYGDRASRVHSLAQLRPLLEGPAA